MTTKPPTFKPAAKIDASSPKKSATPTKEEKKKEEKRKKQEEKKSAKTSKIKTKDNGAETTTPTTPSHAATPSSPGKETTSSASSDAVAEKDRIIAEKDKEIETLKAKIKKYETELRRSDDTILVQEEEIKRLTTKLEALSKGDANGAKTEEAKGTTTTTTPAETSAPSTPTAHEPSTPHHEEDKKGKKKGKESKETKDGKGSVRGNEKGRKTSTVTSPKKGGKEEDAASARRSTEVSSTTPRSSRPSGDYVLTHIKLRSGIAKDAFADLSLVVQAGPGGASGTLATHSGILGVRCAVFDKQLEERFGKKGKGKKKVPKKKSLDIKGFDLTTVGRVLDYLYSDECSYLAKIKPVDVLNLVICARKLNLERLVWLCENQILTSMGLENVVTLLKGSTELKDERIRKFCQNYLLRADTFKEFVLRKDLTTELGMELFTELVTLNATNQGTGAQAEENKLDACPPSQLHENFKSLYESMEYADGFVVLDKETIKFHKAVLAATSKRIFDAFNKSKLIAGQLEDVSSELELTQERTFHGKLSAEAFKSLLRFVYYGETEIEALPACLLIPFAKHNGLAELQSVCERKIQASVTNSRVVMKILAVTYLTIMASREEMKDKLKRDCTQHILGHLREVDVSEIKQMENTYSLDLAVDLLMAIQKNSK